MANSFRKIDYRLRPAKAVERRMMSEAFLRLREFASLESYRYIGMGSVYFSDFSLFHSACGFETMISIEDISDPIVQERFRFNRPLSTIELIFKHSNIALTEISWDIRSVVWMDYDGSLDASVLTDVRFLASKICPGSSLSLSVNCDLQDHDSGDKSRFEILSEKVGSDKIPHEIAAERSIRPIDIPKIIRKIISNELTSALSDRNSARPAGQKICAEQIFFFKYHDGAPMLTLGWVFFDEGQRQSFSKCGFDSLPFTRNLDDFFDIKIPLITSAEIRELNRLHEPIQSIPPAERDKHNAVKRYLPMNLLQGMS